MQSVRDITDLEFVLLYEYNRSKPMFTFVFFWKDWHTLAGTLIWHPDLEETQLSCAWFSIQFWITSMQLIIIALNAGTNLSSCQSKSIAISSPFTTVVPLFRIALDLWMIQYVRFLDQNITREWCTIWSWASPCHKIPKHSCAKWPYCKSCWSIWTQAAWQHYAARIWFATQLEPYTTMSHSVYNCGDPAYPLSVHLQGPFKDRHLTLQQSNKWSESCSGMYVWKHHKVF